MRKKILSLTLLLATLLMGGCHQEIEQRIQDLRNDIASIETQLSQLSEYCSSLSELISALEKNEHIISIRPYSFADRSGYQIVFTSGNSLIIRNGVDGDTPIIGVRYNDTYEGYYWTIQMGESGTPTWMTNSYGLRVRATGTVPQLKIEDNLWWYSFDGSSWVKCNWGPAQGQEGESVFVSIDTSNPYKVVFFLKGSTYFEIPTQLAVDELNAQCNSLNATMKTYSHLIDSVGPSAYIKSVSAFEEDGLSGYRFNMENGEVFSVRNGLDNRDSVLVSARAYTDSKYYWAWRNRSSDSWQWMLYQGEMVRATMDDATPYLGVTDSLGKLYFTVSLAGGPAEMMRDASGKAVQATGRIVESFVTDVDLSDMSAVVLTLADGRKIRLLRTRAHIPSITTSLGTDYVEAETHYTFQYLLFVTDTLETAAPLNYKAYCDSSGISLEAMAIDDGFADAVNMINFTATALSEGSYQYSMILDVPFTTGPSAYWNTTLKSRIAVFLSWQDKTIMKVAEFRRAIMPTSLSIAPSPATVVIGTPVTLSASWLPMSATETSVSWSSGDTAVATVNANGVVTGVAPGTCVITARLGRLSATCNVTVTAAP